MTEPTYTLTITEAQRKLIETALYSHVLNVEELAEDEVRDLAQAIEGLALNPRIIPNDLTAMAGYEGKHTIPMERVVTEDDIDIHEHKP